MNADERGNEKTNGDPRFPRFFPRPNQSATSIEEKEKRK